MKFVTFEVATSIGAVQRTGILRDGKVVDLNAACATYLREGRYIWRWSELANELVPTEMIKLIENGPIAIDAIHLTLEHLDRTGNPEKSEKGERLLYQQNEV